MLERLAVFVEGNTEAIFVKKMIEQIAGKNNVRLEHRSIRGGVNAPRTIQINATQPFNGQKYFVLIIDCGGDGLVKTRIMEEHESFTQKGYSKIIGLRDVRPTFTFADIPMLEANLPKYIKTKLIPVEFILSIMEIEAWFLAESSHFPKINPAITVEAIKSLLGFDPENEDMEQRFHPAEDLNNCYKIGGVAYRKKNAARTVNRLDFTLMYLEFGKKFDYLGRFLKSIDDFFS
ncbi:MAG: hypothetical protein M0P70_07705 [Desulfobulbaceae bacterium]|nr:hypothetical protein [Desulfobulbaceae bacterium]